MDGESSKKGGGNTTASWPPPRRLRGDEKPTLRRKTEFETQALVATSVDER
jgi:hypothetical protein